MLTIELLMEMKLIVRFMHCILDKLDFKIPLFDGLKLKRAS